MPRQIKPPKILVPDKLVTPVLFAKIMNISRQTVYQRIDRGTLPVFNRPKDAKYIALHHSEIPKKYLDEALDIGK
jgi:hypothetical protein